MCISFFFTLVTIASDKGKKGAERRKMEQRNQRKIREERPAVTNSEWEAFTTETFEDLKNKHSRSNYLKVFNSVKYTVNNNIYMYLIS